MPAQAISAIVGPCAGQVTRGAVATSLLVANPMSTCRHVRLPPPLSNHGATTPQRPRRPLVPDFLRSVTTSFGRPSSNSRCPDYGGMVSPATGDAQTSSRRQRLNRASHSSTRFRYGRSVLARWLWAVRTRLRSCGVQTRQECALQEWRAQRSCEGGNRGRTDSDRRSRGLRT